MLSIVLAVAAALAEPNTRDLWLHPLRHCGGPLGLDMLLFSVLADFGPAVLTSLIVAAYLCGDRLEGLVKKKTRLLSPYNWRWPT
jgi:hypothetical protein